MMLTSVIMPCSEFSSVSIKEVSGGGEGANPFGLYGDFRMEGLVKA
jgi:hypothetical protein